MKTDLLILKEIEVFSRIGVPNQERRRPQRLLISIDAKIPRVSQAARSDSLDKTVDYFEIYQGIHKISKSKPRKLLETLAEEISSFILKKFPIQQVVVKVQKFIFNDAKFVAIQIKRRKTHLKRLK